MVLSYDDGALFGRQLRGGRPVGTDESSTGPVRS